MIDNQGTKEKQKGFLISVYTRTDQKTLCEEHLQELSFLAKTWGVEVVGKLPCFIRKFDPAMCISSGKLVQIKDLIEETSSNLVIFDDEITPAQQRNLEQFFGCQVMDRTGVILGVFAKRAQTKEAKLQIELAQVKYEAPRLKRLWTHLSRQKGTGGGGGYLKGEGEKQIEIDRRILKQKVDQLQKEIKEVQAVRSVQRSARMKSEIPIFAFVGYTNVGKSTLLNALTEANVFVEDQLFATLDTTTRKFTLPNRQEILLIDTVGFIRKLPHLLVAAFKSTLEEALKADILIHMIDASHPMAQEQAEATMQVLKELGLQDTPIIFVLNKMDQCPQGLTLQKLRLKYPGAVCLSALKKEGIEELYEKMIQELSRQRKTVSLKVPQSEYGSISELLRLGFVLSKDYEDNDILLEVDLPLRLVEKMKRYIQTD